MHTKILAAILFMPAITFADPASLDGAIASNHESSNRVHYYAQATTIAERDIVSATITRAIARKRWDDAIRADHPADAGKWAMRYHDARLDEARARDRAAQFSDARDAARADFRASAEQTRRLTRQASRARVGRTRG